MATKTSHPILLKATTPTTLAPSTTPASSPGAPLGTAQRDAFAYLKQLLDSYGLGSLAGFVQTELLAGRSQAEIAADLTNTPEFKQAFPEIDARKRAGLPALSPGEIISYRNAATQMLRAAGMPKGFYDQPSDFQQLLTGDVSLNELNDRIQQAKDATFNIPPEVQQRLAQEFGLAPGSGGLAAYFLDPNRALPLLQRQFEAAQIGGAADRVGYSGVTNQTAQQLAQQGITSVQAQDGFGKLAHDKELFTGLPGQHEASINQDTQLAAQFGGNVDAQNVIERRRQARQAEFADGGAFAAGQAGMSGIGSVSR